VKCKREFSTDVIDHIDLSEDQELIRGLKSGKANRVQCPKCKKVMYLKRSIVINFEPQNLIVIYDPKARSKKVKEELEREYRNIIMFSEALEETAADLEFIVTSSLPKLKKLLDEYKKTYG
jgi:hypothetical protein